jgi:VIT1/CCC1 family predicted Fe2+/Mn2+ transporter
MELYDNWREEKRSAWLYGKLAEYEKNILHKKLFKDLQQAAEKQAGLWETKIAQQHLKAPESFAPDLRMKIVAFLVQHLGTDNMHRILAAMKIRGMSVFMAYHSEHRHTDLSTSSNLRAAVFGVNDGLLSNMSLILGISGAQADPHFIILAGVAGLLAGACSMGAGEYISVRSQREVFEYQIAIEKEELEEYPEEEIEELSLIYQARGIAKKDADTIATLMVKNPQTGLNTLAREELGLNPEDLVSPVGAMLSSFFSFAAGAFVPLIPFLFMHSAENLVISMVLTGTALFCIGMTLSLFTNRNPYLAGLRMLGIGVLAGVATFMIGRMVGVG